MYHTLAEFAFRKKKRPMSRRQRSLRNAGILGGVAGAALSGGRGVGGRLGGAFVGASGAIAGRAVGHEVFGVQKYTRRKGLFDRMN